ncbi:hypothetical protein SCHPADRAFT_946935 [Schizopora paradoxa]|uniref:Uncharacterized protein n=1 Tax=Schizopora paradoxa TaxID=27342 RepID=A0A0H2R0Y8_9AGAM|nr:hypothetical protein SCHPADRAFT_946935 [Schizopora paradoxa]
MDPRSAAEKKSLKPSNEVNQALAKRRRQRAAKKERKRCQRNDSTAPETQHAVSERKTESVEEKELEMDENDTVVEGKGALSSSFDNTETIGIDWADDVDASIPCLQPMFITEPPPRDLSCLRTGTSSPWSSLCRRHQRVQRRQSQHSHLEPRHHPSGRPQRPQHSISRADASAWWRRSSSSRSSQPRTAQPRHPRPDFRWQPPLMHHHRFKPRQAQVPHLKPTRPRYKTDRSIQTDFPPPLTSNCSVQTETPIAPPTRQMQEVAIQSEHFTLDASAQTDSLPAPPTKPIATQTDPIYSSSVSIQTDPTPPTDPRAYQRLFQIANYTRKDEDAIFEAAQLFVASPLSSTVSDALIGLHNLLFTQSFPAPAPTMLPYDPSMRFIAMYVKGWYASWLKYQL